MSFAHAYDPIRALQSGWRLIGRAPLPLLVGGVLLVFTGGVRLGGTRVLEVHEVDFGVAALLQALLCCGFGFGLVAFLANCWLSIGFANAVEEAARTGNGDLATIFEPKGRMVSMVLARILVFLAQLAAAVPFAILGIGAVVSIEELRWADELVGLGTVFGVLLYLPVFVYVCMGLALVAPAVALEGREPSDAVRRSWELARGNRLRLFVYFLVMTVVALIGFCLCCVGVFFTATLANVAQFESFLRATRGDETTGWWVERGDAPPPVPPAPAA